MSRWAFRRDSNESEIFDGLVEVAGAHSVWKVEKSRPAGFADLVVWYAGRFWALEVKRRGRPITPEQQRNIDSGRIKLVRNLGDALRAIGAIRGTS